MNKAKKQWNSQAATILGIQFNIQTRDTAHNLIAAGQAKASLKKD